MTLKKLAIPRPSATEVEKYNGMWHDAPSQMKYRKQEQVVLKVFREMYPRNKVEEEILVKVQILNLFYSTNIFNTTVVAGHIFKITNIDELLKKADAGIVETMAQVTFPGKGTRKFYSFATKYCHHHNPTGYPIYDKFVHKVLMHFKKQDHFHVFGGEDLKDYLKFKTAICEFIKFYNLEKYSFRELDIYLWLLGKEYF